MSERLEDAISVIRNMVKIFHEQQGIGFQLSEHAEYVIQQAERVEELEKLNHFYANEVARGHLGELSNYELIEEENQRYKQALEDIRDITTGSAHAFAVKALEGEI